MITTVFKTAGDARDLTLRRPSYKTFRNIAAKVSGLLEVEFDIAMSTPEFQQVLQACTVENIDDWLDEADYQEAAALWDAIMEHCEFPAFFAERQKQHFENSLATQELETKLMAARVTQMKNAGLLPETFSLESALSEGMNPLPFSIPSSSSPITTVTTTDGPETESSAKTSGSSSATSQKPSSGGKRKPG